MIKGKGIAQMTIASGTSQMDNKHDKWITILNKAADNCGPVNTSRSIQTINEFAPLLGIYK